MIRKLFQPVFYRLQIAFSFKLFAKSRPNSTTKLAMLQTGSLETNRGQFSSYSFMISPLVFPSFSDERTIIFRRGTYLEKSKKKVEI